MNSILYLSARIGGCLPAIAATTFAQTMAGTEPVMANFINNIRNDLAAPKMPFVIATVEKNNPAAGTDKITLRVPKAGDARKFARLKIAITH